MRWLCVLIVTIVEGSAVYVWLLEGRDPLWSWWIALLFVGETLETGFTVLFLRRMSEPQPPGDPLGVKYHQRRLFVKFFIASPAEVAVWLAWIWTVDRYGQQWGAVALLVLMHTKHQFEAAAVGDHAFSYRFFSGRTMIASFVEVTGAVVCLALLEEDELLLAAVALGVGLLAEHAILVDALWREQRKRGDIGVPLPRRPPRPLRLRLALFFATRFRTMWELAGKVELLRRWLSRRAVNALVKPVPARPNRFSTMSNYTSWASLTDKTWSGLHLAPRGAGTPEPPSVDRVAELFRREEFIPCPKSTMLFAGFAQWFVDGFLRTQREDRCQERDTRRNESTHDVDLSQLYGLNTKMQHALRTMRGGLLRSRIIHGEEYPWRLCSGTVIRPEFSDVLMTPFRFEQTTLVQRRELFAMGTDVRNVGFVAFNVLFLREHNRIARELARAYPDWVDEQLFQTARMVLTVILMKIVVEDYINHISPAWFRVTFEPKSFQHEAWMRPNWMALEFDLLYRWHGLIPPEIALGDKRITPEASLTANGVLTSMGLGAYMKASSIQPAGRISIRNTDGFLVRRAERQSLEQARRAGLRPYNDYRELCGLPRLHHLLQFSTDAKVAERLLALYDSVDKVEFYVGLFAEEASRHDVLPPLMGAMVAFDAFSQIMTNPLLAPQIYGRHTFSRRGMEIIEDEKHTIKELVLRNAPGVSFNDYISFTRRSYVGP